MRHSWRRRCRDVWHGKKHAHRPRIQNHHKHVNCTFLSVHCRLPLAMMRASTPRRTRQSAWLASTWWQPGTPVLNTFIHHQAAANAPDVPSLTLSPDVLSVANTGGGGWNLSGTGEMFRSCENNPFSFNQDYDKCFSRESGDRYRAFHKENCPFFLPLSLSLSRFLCESVQVTQGRERREAI